MDQIDRQTQITIACELKDAITAQSWEQVKEVWDRINNLKPMPYERYGFLEQHLENDEYKKKDD